MKFTNCHGLTGSFSFQEKKYSFSKGVFECDKSEKRLIAFLKGSTAWTDFKPSAEDKIKESDEVNKKLKADNEKLKADNEKLIKDLEEATKS